MSLQIRAPVSSKGIADAMRLVYQAGGIIGAHESIPKTHQNILVITVCEPAAKELPAKFIEDIQPVWTGKLAECPLVLVAE